MIKVWIVICIVIGRGFYASADSVLLQGLEGERFQPAKNIEVAWEATNILPHGLWIYKAVPKDFSMAVISNMMNLGNFEWKNLTSPRDPPVADKNLICFRDSKGIEFKRYLNIAPTLGWIEYSDGANNVKDGDAPSSGECEQLAFDILFQLGVDRSLLCHEKTNYVTIQGQLSSDGQKLTTNVVSRAISFARQIDGIQSAGFCFMLDVGRRAKIEHFFFTWRNLLPYETRNSLTPDEIIKDIKAGKSLLSPWNDSINLKAIKKLTIVKITPYYFDKRGMEPVNLIYPYADLEAIANLEGTNTATIYLQCSILSTNMFGK